MPVDGSCDHELKIKGFAPGELVIGDWAHSEDEAGYGTTENENSEQPPSGDNVEFQLQDEFPVEEVDLSDTQN